MVNGLEERPKSPSHRRTLIAEASALDTASNDETDLSTVRRGCGYHARAPQNSEDLRIAHGSEEFTSIILDGIRRVPIRQQEYLQVIAER